MNNNGDGKAVVDHKCGAVIKFDKIAQNITREIVRENESENIVKKVYFNDNIQCPSKKERIYNLLKRNFNPEMKKLINCCIKNGKVYQHQDGDKFMNLGRVNLWALYGDMNETELLCTLLWRSVGDRVKRGDSNNWSKDVMMFEVLFLSTSEHIRYQHYGQEMVKRINSFARSNCYDIISVAAVPNHGAAFWKSNGFTEYFGVGPIEIQRARDQP